MVFGYYTRNNNDNIPSLVSIAQMEETETNKIVCGYHREQLAEIWDTPNKSGSMEDVWIIDDGVVLTVNYNNNDKAVICCLSN